MERGESVVVNLRLDEDENTDYAAFDHARVMRILGRIASDLEDLATGRPNSAEDGDNPAARHRRQLAEPQAQAKKLSTREERNALRAKLKPPPK